MSQADARSFVDRIAANQQLGQELSELSERADVSPATSGAIVSNLK